MSETSPVDDDRLTTIGLLFEANAGLHRQFGHRLEEACGLSLQWFEVLLRLVRSPGGRLRMTDLAAQTTLTPSGLTRAVDRLEAAGFVHREPCASDRRGSFASLTADGRARIEAAIPVHLAHVEELFAGVLTPADLEALTGLLRKLRDTVNPAAALASECPATS